MSDAIGVVKRALALLSDRTISGFDDGTALSDLAKTVFPDARDSVLEAHPWNFASTTRTLVPSAREPELNWRYQFPFPQEPYCIAPRNTQPKDVAWEVGYDAIDKRIVLTNEPELVLQYTCRIEDIRLWTPLACTTLSYFLASEFALFVTGQGQIRQNWWAAFTEVLPTAMGSDSRQGYPIELSPPQGLTRLRR